MLPASKCPGQGTCGDIFVTDKEIPRVPLPMTTVTSGIRLIKTYIDYHTSFTLYHHHHHGLFNTKATVGPKTITCTQICLIAEVLFDVPDTRDSKQEEAHPRSPLTNKLETSRYLTCRPSAFRMPDTLNTFIIA